MPAASRCAGMGGGHAGGPARPPAHPLRARVVVGRFVVGGAERGASVRTCTAAKNKASLASRTKRSWVNAAMANYDHRSAAPELRSRGLVQPSVCLKNE